MAKIIPPHEKAQTLLGVIVEAIRRRKIRIGEPRTFLSYSEALSAMGIAPHGRAGQQLRRVGLDELNEWTKAHRLPKIAGLIVEKKTHRPSAGFAKSHGRASSDWEEWWLAETAKAIALDWSPYLAGRALEPEPAARVREDEDRDTPRYRKIITIEPGKRGGRPCIRGMRITVGDILGWLAAGMSEPEIIDDFPELNTSDIHAALAFAADREKHAVSLAGMHR